MDAFSYLSVLLSIIIGLAITQVLQGVRALLLARDRVVIYWPTLIWSALLLVFATQSWWASFGMVHVRHWTFAGFGLVLFQSALLYLMAALVLPDAQVENPIDLPAHYERQRVPFFAVALGMLATSLVKDHTLNGEWTTPLNLAFHGFFAILALAALLTPNRRYHHIAATLMILFIFAYIGLLFSSL